MIRKIRGRLTLKKENKVYLEVGGISYEISIPKSVYEKLNGKIGEEVELVIYHYFQMEKNKSIPFMIGFVDELERDFFEKFITVSGIGPRAALKAFQQPIPLIAESIEKGDINFLSSLAGIGKQKAKQIVAHLQGKVGRFALIKEGRKEKEEFTREIKETVEEAKHILRRLQYSSKEIEVMIKKALEKKPDVNNVEELLNQIYYENR